MIIGISSERLSERLWEKEIWELLQKGLSAIKEAGWWEEDRDREWEFRQIPGAVPGSAASPHRCLKRCRQPHQTGRLLLLLTPSLWNSTDKFKVHKTQLHLIKLNSDVNKDATMNQQGSACSESICFLRFFLPMSLSESESEAAFDLLFCRRKSSSLSLPLADSEKKTHNKNSLIFCVV